MMADGGGKLLLETLNEEEYKSIPQEICAKIEACLNKHLQDFITAKAVLESTKAANDDKIKSLANQLANTQKERDEVSSKLAETQDELQDIKKKLESTQSEVNRLNETLKRYETETSEFRRQRDVAIDERDEAVRMIERRDNELRRLQEDVSSLTSQLQAAVTAKCEALANSDEVQSQKLALDFKEKWFQQERTLLNQQVQSLTEDLAKKNEDINNLRREHTNNVITLKTQLAEKTEELRIVSESNAQLTKTNAALNTRIEDVTQKLISQCESESKMSENYQQEIRAQTRLAELYKGLNEEAVNKTNELTSAIKELQKLLNDANQQYGELETRLKEKEEMFKSALEKKDICIQALRKELEHANELFKAAKQESLENAIESLSPAAAATSRLLKSGLTLTQLYSQYAQISEELMLEREENRRLNLYMNTILKEIEEKAPVLKKQREDYNYAMTTVENLTTRVDEMENESAKLRQSCFESEKLANHLTRENKRLQETVADLGRQVCFLLKEVEESRGATVCMTNSSERLRADITASAKIISKHLVTFSDIQELQITNQKLLAVVRELSAKQEQAEKEKDSQQVKQLESRLQMTEQQLADLKDNEERHYKALEIVKGQRDMYRTLFNQQVAGTAKGAIESRSDMIIEESELGTSAKSSSKAESYALKEELQIKELEKRLKDKERQLAELKNEYETHRKERSTNESMLNETIERLRDELREKSSAMSEILAREKYTDERFKTLKANTDAYKAQIAALEQKDKNSTITIARHEQSILHLKDRLRDELREKSSAMSEILAREKYTDERFKTLKANADAYKVQIAALEQKDKNSTITIARHEQSILHLKDEAVAANSKLARAEVMLENLKHEHQLLKESEARLVKEKEIMLRDKQGQAQLLANIQAIQTSVDRSKAEGIAYFETRLEESQKECSALRRRLQEEQDRFRERINALERAAITAKTRVEEEKEINEKLHKELNETKELLKQSTTEIDQLNAKVRSTAHKIVPDPQTEKRAMMLERQLAEKEGEIVCLKEQIVAAKKHSQEFYDISQSVEKQLAEVTSSYNAYKEETSTRLAAAFSLEAELKKTISDLQAQVTTLSSAQKESASSLGGKLKSHEAELSTATVELTTLRIELTELKAELETVQKNCQLAEEKYAHEMVLHAKDLEALTKVKEELCEVSARVADLKAEKDKAVETLKLGQESWTRQEESMKNEIKILNERVTDLTKQNDILHEQLQELGLKVAVVQSQSDSANVSLDSSLSEDSFRNSDQLLQVMKYLRQEKNIALAQLDVLRAENIRLQTRAELLNKQFTESKEMLNAERSNNDVTLVTAAKHDELLRKVETLNALTDSNRSLREERDRLSNRVTELEKQIENTETGVIGPANEQIYKLTNQVETLTTENTALRGDSTRWRQRANVLLEKANKNSPEDVKRLTTEKENLTKQLNTEKEELRNTKLEKLKLEEQMKKLQQTQAEEVTSLQQTITRVRQELTDSRAEAEKKSEELTKITQELSTQEAVLSDIRNKEIQIRQIAKKYKTQYQELMKSNEEEKKKEASTSNEVSTETQERLREEGRKEAETTHADRLRELNEQITGLQAEATTLRKENEGLKVSNADKEERAKVLLKNARARILLLTDEKKTITKDMETYRDRLNELESNKDGVDVRLRRAEKEKAEQQAEKERLSREVELLTQRLSLLQRQLEKQQGTKPTTSSSLSEKSNVEPPTANIKPMAGPSSSVAKQQQTQQSMVSVTVQPWRGGGETPFASIRPMSLQSRTAAVLPTTNQSQGQAVLVPPQQQMVHTSTGVEVLSSSPTSSHTDYMPATSSAAVVIRQAAVPPTQQPPPSAESTQDMEAECGEGGQTQGGLQSPGTQQQSVPSTQALSIALVLPQPTAQTSSQTTQTQPQVQLASAENSSVVSASNQEQVLEQSVVSASNHMPNTNGDQGFVSASSGQQQTCSTVSAYYRQGTEESGHSVASSHSANAGEQQSVVASSESQLAEASGSGTVVSSHPPAEQSIAAVVASSQANSSNTVTTTQAGPGSKRPRDTSAPAEDDGSKSVPPAKRIRATVSAAGGSGGEPGEMLLRADGLEVEYQVPTSSQRDQEDDIVLIDSDDDEEEDDEGMPDDGGIEDGQEFEEEADNEEVYEIENYSRDDQDMAMTSYEEGEGPDIDEENITDQDNNEVEIIEDSNEVPNQSESSSSGNVEGVGGDVETGGEATSSGQGRSGTGAIGRGDANVSSNQATPGPPFTRRASATHIPPLNRQQQLLLPQAYEDVGDDSIVPSTPTLFVPRRTDGFGEAVSSPHVPSGRFTFSDNNPPTTRAGVAQVASEGMDDTRMDLSQLEDSGTGRSVPSTPLQVSPQDPAANEVGQSSACGDDQSHGLVENNNNNIPIITVTGAHQNENQEMPPPSDVDSEENAEGEGRKPEDRKGESSAEVLEEPEVAVMDLPEESGDGVSSEGEKSTAVLDEEEGREAEASEAGSSNIVVRGSGTARRSARGINLRTRTRTAPTPIIFDDDEPSNIQRSQFRNRGLSPLNMRSTLPSEQARGFLRGRPRRPRSYIGGMFQSRF